MNKKKCRIAAVFLTALCVSLMSFADTNKNLNRANLNPKYSVSIGAPAHIPEQTILLPGMQLPSTVTRDTFNIAHINSKNKYDMYFVQGYIHAQDRLFQMDVLRRQAGGTLAALLGESALPGDIEFRSLGLRDAAQRSWDVLSENTQRIIMAYTSGVNSFVASSDLPSEYSELEINTFEPWNVIDTVSVSKLMTLGTSFDLGDIRRTVEREQFLQAGEAFNFDGDALYFDDIARRAPFYAVTSSREAPENHVSSTDIDVNTEIDQSFQGPAGLSEQVNQASNQQATKFISKMDQATTKKMLALSEQYLNRVQAIPYFNRLNGDIDKYASNGWAISAKHTASGFPLLANDPHLPLGALSTFYPMHLSYTHDTSANSKSSNNKNTESNDTDSSNNIGSTYPGIPSIVLGHNGYFSWGSTARPLDVTDVYLERVVADSNSASGFSTEYKGRLEPMVAVEQVYWVNHFKNGVLNDVTPAAPSEYVPAVTYHVPRRNMGPIVQFDRQNMLALSIQYTGFAGTREMEAFIDINAAKNMDEFQQAIKYMDVGSQDLVYSDNDGNIAYFTPAKIPLREDLNRGEVHGLPPSFIRSGLGDNEWLRSAQKNKNTQGTLWQEAQALPYQILPEAEMPRLINPSSGWFVSANHDSSGTLLDNDPYNQYRKNGGVLYLNSQYAQGLRAERITQLIQQKLSTGDKKLSLSEMQDIQDDVVLLDAPFFVPYIVQALKNARKKDAYYDLHSRIDDKNLIEAVNRLSKWNFTAPTGIDEGYDNKDKNGHLSKASKKEVRESIAATIYSVWRGRFIHNTIVQSLNRYELSTLLNSNSLTSLKMLLENFDTQQGFGLSGVNFFHVSGIDSASNRRDILLLKSVSDALNLLSGEAFANAFQYSNEQNDYRWGKLHRIVFNHPMGEPLTIPSQGADFAPPLDGLLGIPTDGGFGSIDPSSHKVYSNHEDDFMYSQGSANRYVSQQGIDTKEIQAKSIWPGEVNASQSNTSQPDEAKNTMLKQYLTNDRININYSVKDINKNRQKILYLKPKK